jgi:hypothetical protein
MTIGGAIRLHPALLKTEKIGEGQGCGTKKLHRYNGVTPNAPVPRANFHASRRGLSEAASWAAASFVFWLWRSGHARKSRALADYLFVAYPMRRG